METYSFSKLNRFDQCEQNYAAIYGGDPRVAKMPYEESNPSESGKGVHRFQELYRKHCQEMQVEQDLGVVPDLIQKAVADRDLRSTQMYDDIYFTSFAWAKGYKHNFETCLGIEMHLNRVLMQADGKTEVAMISGYSDMVELCKDDKGEIVVARDEKTGWKREITPSHRFQGEVYSWKLMPMFPGMRVGYQIGFSRWPKSETPIVELEPVGVPRVEAHMRAIIDRIREARRLKRFRARPGHICNYCPVAVKCAERNVLVRNEVIVDSKEIAESAVKQALVLEAALKQRENQLKSYVDGHGAIVIGALKAGYFEEGGNPQIKDPEKVIMAAGIDEAVRSGLLTNAEDPLLRDPDVLNRVLQMGTRKALAEGLLSVNGNKTKTKAVQNDARFTHLWVPGPVRSPFKIKDGVEQIEEEVEA